MPLIGGLSSMPRMNRVTTRVESVFNARRMRLTHHPGAADAVAAIGERAGITFGRGRFIDDRLRPVDPRFVGLQLPFHVAHRFGIVGQLLPIVRTRSAVQARQSDRPCGRARF